MARSTTLGRRFGAYYLLLVALLSIVCVVVVLNLGRMLRDAERLLEETREHSLATEVLVRIRVLDSLVGVDPPRELLPSEIENAQVLLLEVQRAIERLGARRNDPSRAAHQAKEERLVGRVVADLGGLSDMLGSADPEEAEIDAILEHTRAFAATLDAETRREGQRADEDLVAHAATTRGVMIATVVAVTVALCVGFLHVLRTVVGPLGIVRAGADRFGAGDLGHRISVSNRDEIGDLARSFNQMADRVADTRSGLEEQVATRTREFIRAARLADLGVLAAGVAHEINNPLASIASCAEGLERRLARGEVHRPELEDYLGTISSEAYRAREITSRLLALARQEQGQMNDVDLALVMRQVETAVSGLLEARRIRLCSSFPLQTMLRGNAGDLIQILVNLVLNARDASAPGSAIHVRCRVEEDWILFEVEDRGHGIAPGDLERIFDPFYTTKRPGEGTGLGLALVAALVEVRGGRIGVVSRPGEGSLFTVSFPRRWRESA